MADSHERPLARYESIFYRDVSLIGVYKGKGRLLEVRMPKNFDHFELQRVKG